MEIKDIAVAVDMNEVRGGFFDTLNLGNVNGFNTGSINAIGQTQIGGNAYAVSFAGGDNLMGVSQHTTALAYNPQSAQAQINDQDSVSLDWSLGYNQFKV